MEPIIKSRVFSSPFLLFSLAFSRWRWLREETAFNSWNIMSKRWRRTTNNRFVPFLGETWIVDDDCFWCFIDGPFKDRELNQQTTQQFHYSEEGLTRPSQPV